MPQKIVKQEMSFISKLSAPLKEISRNKVLLLMLMPLIMVTVIFRYIPMGGVIIAFKDYNYRLGILGSPWCGFDNFEYLFKSGMLWNLTKNTLLYNTTFIVLGTFLKVLFAVLISEMVGKRTIRLMQSTMLLPHFISWVIVGGFAYSLLNYEFGVLNNYLEFFGFKRVDIYNTPSVWKYILVFVDMWKTVGYGTIFYLTAITGINPELYEAAYIDGAGLFQRIRTITLPLLTPTVIILVLLSLSGILSGNFQMFYQLIGTNGVLYKATDVIDTYVFRSLMVDKDFALSAAGGFYQQIVGFVLVISVNWLVRRYESDYALF